MFAVGDWANVSTEEWSKRRKEECEAHQSQGAAGTTNIQVRPLSL
jgi:hypothetical protein